MQKTVLILFYECIKQTLKRCDFSKNINSNYSKPK